MVDKRELDLRAPLKIHFEGPAVRYNRMALQDLMSFAGQLQKALDRVAYVLLGQQERARVGRKRLEIRNACSLDIVAITGGSLTVVCDLPVQTQPALFDLGEDALEALIGGLNKLNDRGAALPRGYDISVLMALRDAGRVLDHGVTAIRFELHTGKGQWGAVYSDEIRTSITSRIQEPLLDDQHLHVVEGRLLMGDFKESGHRCHIHTPIGKPVPCTFDETLKDTILAALTRYVRAVVEPEEGNRGMLNIRGIEILDEKEVTELTGETMTGFFDQDFSLDNLAVQQQVLPAADFDRLIGDFWPEDESVDHFIEATRRWRAEGESGDRVP